MKPITKKTKGNRISTVIHGNRQGDDYVQKLEEQFEHWRQIQESNKHLTKENKALKSIIGDLLSRIEEKNNTNKDESNSIIDKFPSNESLLKFIRKFFIPTIRPDIVKNKLDLFSSKIVVKKTEDYNLFRFPELVVRVPRTSNNKGKHETTVLYSHMGVIVLESFIKKEMDRLHRETPVVSDEEQKEIEKMFSLSDMKKMSKSLDKHKKKIQTIEL